MSFDLPANGIQLHGNDWQGNGTTPVVLLHGTGLVGMLWAPIASRLAAGTSATVAFDLRGHGQSAKPASGYQWENLARDVELAIAELKLTRLCLVGHSLGGSLTLIIAARRPDLIERCVLIDPVVRKPEMAAHDPIEPGVPTAELALVRRATWPDATAARAFLAAKPPYNTWNAETMDLFVRHGLVTKPDGTVTLACPPRIEAKIYEQRPTFNPWLYLPEIRCRSLFIYGTDPRPDVLAAPTRVVGMVANAQMVRLRGGHFLPFEHPDGVFKAIHGFLTSERTSK